MGVYSVVGTSVVASANNEPGMAVWNPHSTRRVVVSELGFYKNGTGGDRFNLRRTTTRGTPGSTVTPDADNAWDLDDTPPSGVLLDLGDFTSLPTFASPDLSATILNTVTGSPGMGMVWTFPGGLWIPPGTGVAVMANSSLFAPSECYAVWEES